MKKKLLIVAACIAILAVLSIAALFVLRGKSPLVPDTDLQFTRATVSSNENAFFILEEAKDEIFWPEVRSDEIFENEDLANEILSKNKNALELFDKAMLCPRLQVPEIQSFDEEFEYLANWKTLSQLSLLRALKLFHDGNEKSAFDVILRIVQFGHHIESCDGVPLHYLYGLAIKRMALDRLQKLMGNTSTTCDLIHPYVAELNRLYANQPALTNVIKMEYQLQSKFVDGMASGKSLGITNRTIPASGILSPLFKAERTREIYAEFARTGLQSIQLSYKDMLTNAVPASTNRSTLRLLLSGNAVGEVLTGLTMPAQQKFISQKCRENVTVAATQTILALKCYKEKHGSLPPSLENLVPEFLPKLPMDDFDGKPLRYSAEKKIIYSVGQDLIDSGGEEKDAQKKPLDIPFKIEF